MKTKLIIIEGIPGSGKSTTAKYIKTLFDNDGIKSELFNEGDFNHPADYESFACFSLNEYNDLISKYNKELLDKHLLIKENDYLICYGKMKQETNIDWPKELLETLSRHDIYNLPFNQYSRLCKKKWKEFSLKAQQNQEISIFECCFLQNPLCVMLARLNFKEEEIFQYFIDLSWIVKDLNPVIIYLYQTNVRETFNRVILERPKEWLDFCIWYNTEQEYGKAHGLIGFEGLIKYYEVFRELEVEIFKKLQFRKIFIDVSDFNWDKGKEEIKKFLKDNL